MNGLLVISVSVVKTSNFRTFSMYCGNAGYSTGLIRKIMVMKYDMLGLNCAN